jgi:hypothetical protein
MSTATLAAAGAYGLALYAGHHVGDYWVQTDEQARHKGAAGALGALHCAAHVASYLGTQWVCLFVLELVTGAWVSPWGLVLGLAVSGVTHYLADRREHGLMIRLARHIPGLAAFLKLGAPRDLVTDASQPGAHQPEVGVRLDNPTLGTGAWALDQSWHIFWGVFVAALIMAGLS